MANLPTAAQIDAVCGCGNRRHSNLIACPPTPGDDGNTVQCATCGQPIKFIGSPVGDYWAHAEDATDGHDAFPPNGGHNSYCRYVATGGRCTCTA